MILSASLAAMCGLAALGQTSTATAAVTPERLELEGFRMPYDALVDRTIGKSARAVGFDWRKTTAHAAVLLNQPVEFNNFQGFRLGLMARIPGDTLIYEVGLSYVWVWGTQSSEQLALTPFRQPGRPSRFEIDFLVGLPLAEGVVTAWPAWFPAAELVFSAYFDFRYMIYPGAFSGLRARETLAALFNPKIGEDEIANLDDQRAPGMEIDTQRYGFYAGLGTDIYFDFGLFVSPRVMFTVPLLAAATDSKMIFGMDFTLAVGAAF